MDIMAYGHSDIWPWGLKDVDTQEHMDIGRYRYIGM